MKKNFTLITLFGIFLYVTLSSRAAGPGASSGLEASGATGSTTYCGGGCHGSALSTSTAPSIQLSNSSGAVTSYVPGSTYTVTVGAANTGATTLPRFGFQLTAVKSVGAGTGSAVNGGTFGTAPAGTHTISVSGINIFEHSSPLSPTSGTGGAGSLYGQSIVWTAPATGTGSVVFYGVVNLVDNGGTDNAADKWNYTTLTITEGSSGGVASIAGSGSVCTGSTTTLTDATTGGTWSSSNTGVATITSGGVVSGVTAGTTIITYDAGTSGVATRTVTVNLTPGPISGLSSVCTGATITLTDASTGGLQTGWISGITSIATVGSSTGVVTGVSVGTTLITYGIVYAISPSIAACYTTNIITVNSAIPPAITSPSVVCVGSTIAATDAATGGTWTSGSTANATVSSTGVISGVAVGTAIISYATSNSCGSGYTTRTVTVHAAGTCNNAVNNVPGTAGNGLSIFPNPSSGTFTISVLTDDNEPAHIVITNILGAKVKELDITTNTASDLKLNQPSGMYFIEASTDNKRYVSKIRIQ